MLEEVPRQYQWNGDIYQKLVNKRTCSLANASIWEPWLMRSDIAGSGSTSHSGAEEVSRRGEKRVDGVQRRVRCDTEKLFEGERRAVCILSPKVYQQLRYG